MSSLSSPSGLFAAQRLRWNALGLVFWWFTVRSDLWVTVVRLCNTTIGRKHSQWDIYPGRFRSCNPGTNHTVVNLKSSSLPLIQLESVMCYSS